MWTSNRGHIFRVDGIQCHNIGVCSNVVVQKTRNVSRYWPNSYCSNERCQVRILLTMKYIDCRDVYGERLRLPTRFEPDSVRKTLLRPIVQSETSGQMVSILFFLNNFVINVDIEPCHIFRVDGIQCHNIGVFEFCRDVYWERLHLSTRFQPDSVRKTEVTADSTI